MGQQMSVQKLSPDQQTISAGSISEAEAQTGTPGAPAPDAITAKEPGLPGAAKAVSTENLPKGASIGRYLVVSRLGAGGMGVVYAAYDPELNRKVAIKLLRSSGRSEDDSLGRVRLQREAQALARLSHPNVISVFDVGTAYSQVFVAMEFVEGGTLGDWLKEKRRTQPELLAMFHQAGRGLAAAHAAGLVHRDFKPESGWGCFFA